MHGHSQHIGNGTNRNEFSPGRNLCGLLSVHLAPDAVSASSCACISPLPLPSSHMTPLSELVLTYYLLLRGCLYCPLCQEFLPIYFLILALSPTNPSFPESLSHSSNCPVLLNNPVSSQHSTHLVCRVVHFSSCDYLHNVFCPLDCEQGLLLFFFITPSSVPATVSPSTGVQ